MAKRRFLSIIAILIGSISLASCDLSFGGGETPTPTPVTPDPDPQPQPDPEPEEIMFTKVTISPTILKVAEEDTLQLTITAYPSNATETGVRFVSERETVATVDQTGLVTGIKAGTSKISVFGAQSGRLLGSSILTVYALPPVQPPVVHIDMENTIEKTDIKQNYKDLVKKSIYGSLDYCPPTGNSKLLVIPVWFSDSDTYIADDHKETVRRDIEKAYFGTNAQVGWKSVKTYYEEESKGALSLNGVVSKWYEIESAHTAYSRGGTGALVTKAVDWYFDLPENASISRNDFDTDNDGYLDGVMLIYAAPDYIAARDDSGSNLWAYCSWLSTSKNLSSPNPNVYFWASYDFMYSYGDYARNRTGLSRYGNGETEHCSIDTHTFIHEMGHVLGLDDYYDYSSQYSPAGGFSMQDHNVGGHDPYSVMAYGWADPYIVTDTAEVTIESFQKTRDFILLSAGWNEYDSPFDEYILLELFTPTGLNEFDSEHQYGGSPKGPNATGIRMWHVDATLLGYKADYSFFLTNNAFDSAAFRGLTTVYTNTYYVDDSNDESRITLLGKSYANYNLLQLIRNNTEETYRPTSSLSERALFKTGTYNLLDYAGQFVKGEAGTFDNDKSLDWTIEVTIGKSDNDDAAKIKLTKNS